MSSVNRHRAPLLEALLRYRDQENVSFHVPGHKNGMAYAGVDEADMLRQAMRIDVTEITGMDDLHHPEGVIQEAQQLASECFGAEESYFLVGGSTSGNLAMILTVCTEPGDIILVQRNVHKSVLNGLMLAGAQAVFLQPEVDEGSGLAVAPSEETVRQALGAYPGAKAVLVTMPNYYGMGSDLRPLAAVSHQHQVPLLVDEAHGAHFGLHPQLPESALSCGADGVVQSTHKMLGAMTMGAMLHVQGNLLDRQLLRQRLAMVQSSSPSYPLMASLDLARHQLHQQGQDAFTAGLAAVKALRRGLAQLPRFGLLQPPQPAPPAAGTASAGGADSPPALRARAAAYTRQDPFKAVIYDRTGALSGYALQRELEARGCVPEMSDELRVVVLFSLGSTLEDANHLLWALMHIVEEGPMLKPDGSAPVTPDVSTWNISATEKPYSLPVPFSLRPVSPHKLEVIRIEESTGRAAGEMVIPYPPGIPILYPGEIITGNMTERLTRLKDAGVKCQGMADPDMTTIVVYKT